MEKIQNCPNNTFDCGFSCGLFVMLQGILKILEKNKDINQQKQILEKFVKILHNEISEKHMEHMNQRYNWEKTLDDLLKKS